MKYLTTVFLAFCLFFVTLHAESPADSAAVLKKVDDLVSQRKYAAAFKLLTAKDPQHTDLELVLKKTELALDYYAQSMMHQYFTFKDLEEGEELLVVRESEGTSEGYSFEIDKILPQLMEKYPEEWRLHLALGKFYAEVHFKYGSEWTMKNDQVIQKSREHFEKAGKNGVVDWYSYYALGYFEILANKADTAVPLFLKSLELNGANAPTHYNLAYTLLKKNEIDKALPHAKKAYELYDINFYKADAAKMLANIYIQKDNFEQALKHYINANELVPNDFYTLRPLLRLYLKFKKYDQAEKMAVALFALQPKNPGMCQELLASYLAESQDQKMLQVWQILKAQYKADAEILGNILFHEASLYLKMEQKDEALQLFQAAKAQFEKALPEDHQVFKIIAQTVADIGAKGKKPAPADKKEK